MGAFNEEHDKKMKVTKTGVEKKGKQFCEDLVMKKCTELDVSKLKFYKQNTASVWA